MPTIQTCNIAKMTSLECVLFCFALVFMQLKSDKNGELRFYEFGLKIFIYIKIYLQLLKKDLVAQTKMMLLSTPQKFGKT